MLRAFHSYTALLHSISLNTTLSAPCLGAKVVGLGMTGVNIVYMSMIKIVTFIYLSKSDDNTVAINEVTLSEDNFATYFPKGCYIVC